MPESDDEFIGFFNKCQDMFKNKEKLNPAEALAGMSRSVSDLAKQGEKYRTEYAQYLRRRLDVITEHPEKKVIPDEPEMLKFLLEMISLMEIQNN